MCLCSSSASHSNSMEFSGGMDSETSVSIDEQKSETSPQEMKKSHSLDNQSRPLPPLPLNIPAEPDDEAPEPIYESIDQEPSYEAVYHQRSISDHILSIRKNSDEDKLRKSNSDRVERHLNRSGSAAVDKDREELILPEKKISNAGKMSNSTPSIGPKEEKDGRVRSITTDSTAIEDGKEKSRPKLTSSPDIENVTVRSYFNSLSEPKTRLVFIFYFLHDLIQNIKFPIVFLSMFYPYPMDYPFCFFSI